MIINGVELAFDLYDAESVDLKERYFAELSKMKNIADEQAGIESEEEQMRFLCRRIKKMFDNVFGKGTGEEVCGTRDNLLVCMAAYEQLVSEQVSQNKQYQDILNRVRRNGSRGKRK